MDNELEYIKNSFTKTGDNVNLDINNLNVACITSKNNNFNLDSEGNLTVKTITALSSAGTSIVSMDAIYPVGSIYMSINNTNPSTLFGGVWEQIENRFLLGAGSNYALGSTGGEATHVLTTAEMPSHTHTIASSGGHDHNARFKEHYVGTDTTGAYDYARSYSQSYDYIKKVNVTNGAHTHAPANTGGGQAHNNMPPYLAVYMWKKTA